MEKKAEDYKQRYRQLLKESSLCTLATASRDGVPEAAEMACAAAPDEGLYLYTLNDSRKYANLSENSRAAMILFKPPEYAQLDGRMEELDGEQAERARQAMTADLEGDKGGYHQDPRCRYFRFSPSRVSLRVRQDYPSLYETWDPRGGSAREEER